MKVGAVCAALLCSLNLTVAWIGETVVFPLSPLFLPEKVQALSAYFAHRPRCLMKGHPPLDREIARATKRHRLPKGLLAAVVQVESEGRPHRISAAGAMGPGQLMPATARALGVADPFDGRESVDAAARYLAQQLRRYRGDVRLAVAAYNAGPGNVGSAVPRNGETEHYVRRVLREYERLRAGGGRVAHGRRP